MPGIDRQPLRVVVLGAGFGGLELTTRLSDELGDGVDVVLVDRTEDFVFGFSKLDVMFGRLEPEQVRHRYEDIAAPGVRFVNAEVLAIDPVARRVETTSGAFEADVLVLALGSDLDPTATPGLAEDGVDFYSEAGAFAARDVLERFEGGRVVIGVMSTPYKCPPAPSETALLVHEHLTRRGQRERSSITLVLPLPSPVPPSPATSAALTEAFDQRGIDLRAHRAVQRLDPERHVAVLDDGSELPYDLFLGVPVHRVPEVVERSGMATDGWVAVDRGTLATRWPGVYAVGDVTSAGTPKAGVFAEGQASVVAEAILAQVRGQGGGPAYDGHGVCYVEFGDQEVAVVDVTFPDGAAPSGFLEGPSVELAAVKGEFGTSRIRRWFGQDWAPLS
ncbi:NAD(P)/FAD-dependent oxidoreductase [Nocardioides cynanchi]|uniref:NAD(P)/FAD-dependent oxidoreductase n=1 Tax=Nocardioides cynanchi TaxID=2558918 RepID=UPI0012471A95|nr:FAD/NAD(P)-binding oxidoreductase [Nocardioides cynanchi]